MTLVPWKSNKCYVVDPFREVESLHDEINRLLNFSLKGCSDADFGTGRPEVDIYDTKDNIVIKADVPGMEKDDIDISIKGDMVILKGEKKYDKKEEKNGYLRTERFYGSFSRVFTLPASVDDSKVKATYKNGVLELVLPKKEEEKSKKVQINAE